MPEMEVERPKKKKGATLEFDAGKVFSAEKDIEKDFELDVESARYKAAKGEGGDRRGQ